MTKFKQIKQLFCLLVVSVTAGLFWSCNNSNDIFTDVYLEDNLAVNVDSYFMKDQLNMSTAPTGQRVYIDFSNGMWQAYKGNANNSGMIDKLTQRLTGSEVKWFGLGKGQIYELDFPSTQLYNKVTDPKSYSTEIMAPIEKTVNDIIEAGEEALLVTDFEEYTTDGKEQFENFAKDEFTKWLKMGNSITFYVTNYQEKNNKTKLTVDKHLYFIVFNTASNKLKENIEYAWKDRGFAYETFDLSTDIYTFENSYPAADKGGQYFDEEGNDIVFIVNKYVNGLNDKKNYELYSSQSVWSDIQKNASGLMEVGVPKQFTHAFRNLFVDLSKDDAFVITKLGVKVTNVDADFRAFINASEAEQHTPKMSKDASDNIIIDPNETDPIALECYNEKGELKDIYKYSKKETVALSELLVLDEDLYRNSYNTNKQKTEIGLKFDKNFTGTIANPSGLIRVDIVIEECEPNFAKIDNMFTWKSPNVKDKDNCSLAESIRNTLTEVNPKGKVVYSYFIKTLD